MQTNFSIIILNRAMPRHHTSPLHRPLFRLQSEKIAGFAFARFLALAAAGPVFMRNTSPADTCNSVISGFYLTAAAADRSQVVHVIIKPSRPVCECVCHARY